MELLNEFDAFLQGSFTDDVVECVVSKRFKDKEGNPIPFKLKAVTAEKNNTLRKECTKHTKKGVPELDEVAYISRLVAECVVYPNLNNAEFQDALGVKTPQAVIGKLLRGGEYDRLQMKVLEINGFDMSMDELVNEAKN